jgi:hypothetical protein
MELGDHSECMVELLACPAHMDEQLRQMGYEPGTANMPQPMNDTEATVFTDDEGSPTVGFCLWCDKDFYSFEVAEAHSANDSAACAVFQQMKDEAGMPPVLQMMLEDAGVPDEGDDGTEPEGKE